MNFGTTYATPKAGIKRVVAAGRIYRNVMITQTEDGYIIQDARGKGHPFATLKQAIDWIDTYFSTHTAAAGR